MYRLNPEFIFTPLTAPLQTSSIYDTSLLKKTLEEFVDPEKLNHPEKTRLVVTAINVQTGRQARFDNAETTLTFDHIIASGSFPITFPMTPIDGEFYWDGGIFLNMPIGAAVNALEQVEADNPNIEREVILVELHRMQGQLPKTVPEAAERFYNLLFSGKLSLDSKLYKKYSAFVALIQEIDKTLPADSPIRKHQGYQDMIRHRTIDRAIVIGEEGIGAMGSSSDFSRKTLQHRIEAGFSDAMAFFENASV
jgi:NTE family protein